MSPDIFILAICRSGSYGLNMKIITRKQAAKRGFKKYFTGEPCNYGHVSERYVKSYKCVACLLQRSKAYHKANPGKAKESWRRWVEKDPKKAKELSRKQSKRYYWGNRNKSRSIIHNTRAKRENSPGKWLESLIDEMGQHCKWTCHCGSDISDDFTIDHIVPISKGGTNYPDNIQLLCPFCNRSKKNKPQDEYLRTLKSSP